MATSSRKKSVASTTTVEIPLPVQTNTLLNKSAASSTSLYQQCSQLRATLMRIEGFPPFLALSPPNSSRQSTDALTHLWDCFALGTPLCYLFNLLPPPAIPIDINTDPDDLNLDPNDIKSKKRAIILFIMAVKKMQQQGQWEESDLFQVTELTDRNMSGFVKVINTVTYLTDRLPQSVFVEPPIPQSPPTESSAHDSSIFSFDNESVSQLPPSSQEVERRNIVRELLETERKYVADLECMQKYAVALLQRNVIDQDTILEIFPGLNKLLDFQRQFLVRLEQTAELPWVEQRWGRCFTDCEEDFVVYEPYCSNYTNAMDVLLREEQHLMELASMINPKAELPAFLIKPVQRICKYPLLLDSLIKATAGSDYPYSQELIAGSASAKRITDRINEAQRRAENLQTVQSLETRIEDWKGHHLVNFGELVLDDYFVVVKSEVDREYHVFLFEKIILCCKENPQTPGPPSKKVGKSNSLLKRPAPPGPGALGPSAAKRKNTPLLLKGRIFLNNVTIASPSGKTGQHELQVWWRGDDDMEYFTLRCRSEEQLKQWEAQISRLVSQADKRRGGSSSLANSTNPAAARMTGPQSTFSPSGISGNFTQPLRIARYSDINSSDENFAKRGSDGFDMDDELDERFPVSVQPLSGRGTPVGNRRLGTAHSMPPEREPTPTFDRVRARTEDTSGQVMQQWRANGYQTVPPLPPPSGGLPPPPNSSRPPNTRYTSADASAYNSGRGSALRSQFSTTMLRSAYDSGESSGRTSRTSQSSHPNSSFTSSQYPTRSRSASIPSSHTPPSNPPPPLPTSHWSGRTPSVTPMTERGEKRDSGSSESTERSSDGSTPHSSSPITPFGSTDSALASATLRSQRSRTFGSGHGNGNAAAMNFSSPPVKVKVHYGEDLFVIIVPRSTDYNDLVDKVGKKIRLCGGKRDSGPLRVKYRDEDGDMVSLGSNEDVQMAFDSTRLTAGGQVTLFVV